MSNIVKLFIKTGSRVIVYDNDLAATVHHSAAGSKRTLYPPGTRHYYVDVIDDELGAMIMWDGPSYAEAMAAARDCSAGWDNAPIIDQTRKLQ